MLHLEKEFTVGVPVHRLWPMVSDTERLNRAMGMAPVQYQTRPNVSGPADVFAKMKFGPLTLKYQDFPFEWVENDHFHVLRRYGWGPLKEMRAGVMLSGEKASTRVKIFLEAEPRYALGAWVTKFVMWPVVLRKYQKLLRGLERHLLESGPDPLAQIASRTEADVRRLKILMQRLPDKAISDHLLGHIKNAPDLDVIAMRPFALADRWGQARIAVLKLFLHATRAGVLDLSWEILCPNCRKSKAVFASLTQLKSQAHCDYCQIHFDAEFDQSVEARFRVNPSIRPALRNEFCAGGPGNTPHILAQILVQPGASRTVTLSVLGAPLRVRTPLIEGTARVRILDRAAGDRCKLVLTENGFQPNGAEIHAGIGIFEAENKTGYERWILIERERWDEAVTTAAQVTSLQEFRDMFSSEVLAPGQEISVRSLTFLFTDIAGSTAMYHDLGDAKAYALVREHFEVLKDVIAKHQGALVKTIGDAVMAVFSSPRQGVLAALAMQGALADWNASRVDRKPVVLKIGLHEGPAVAVNTDDILDYFGTSVNLAARVESLSTGGDVVMSSSVMKAVQEDNELMQRMGRNEKLESPVKGFPKPVHAWRVWPL